MKIYVSLQFLGYQFTVGKNLPELSSLYHTDHLMPFLWHYFPQPVGWGYPYSWLVFGPRIPRNFFIHIKRGEPYDLLGIQSIWQSIIIYRPPRPWEKESWACLLPMDGSVHRRCPLTSSAITQAQIHWVGLPISSGVLQIPNCKISMAQGNNKITSTSPDKDSILMVSQKPYILNQTNDSSECSLPSEDVWKEG